MRTSLLFAGFVCMALLVPGLAQGQSAVVTGQVTDANEVPIAGVAVFIEEMSSAGIGTITNEEGRYRLQAPAERVEGQTVTLVARSLGLKTVRREITLSEGVQTESFQLERDVLALDALVVTGVAGETSKQKLAFSVDQLSSEQIELAPPSTAPVQSLQGRVPGVQVVDGSGAPGTGVSVRLRGTTSITGSSQPLYIIDGVIVTGGSLDIDAQDVESIEVVKGAAASSIYGSQAQNGVVQITTKRGRDAPDGGTRIRFSSEFGFNQLPRRIPRAQRHIYMLADSSFVDAEGNQVERGDWLQVKSIGGEDQAVKSTYEQASVDRSEGLAFQDKPYPGEVHDHLDRFYDPGAFVRNFVSVSRRSGDTNFRVSFGNVDEEGVVWNLDGYNRMNARVNLDHAIGDELELSVTGFTARAARDQAGLLNPFAALYLVDPQQDLLEREEDGTLILQPDPRSNVENPLYAIEKTDIDNRRMRQLGNVTLRYSPLPSLSLDGSLGFDRVNFDQEIFYDKGFETINPADYNGGRYGRRHNVNHSVNAQLTASYNRRFGDLTTRTRANVLFERDYFTGTFLRGDGLAAKGVRSLDNITGTVSRSSHIADERGLYGFLATQVDYRDRYILDLLVRRDGSSKFGPDERWHNYYRASGAYRLSEESWWPFEDALDEFKLRYSYGTAGAQPSFMAQYETFGINEGRFTKVALGNKALKPEFQTEQEAGVEFTMFDRLSGEAVYAHTVVEDQLLRVPMPSIFGYNYQWRNAGTVTSSTIEASLEAALLQSRDRVWTVGVVFDRTRQRITEFDVPPFRSGPFGAFQYQEGEELGAIYGHDWVTDVSQLPEQYRSYAGAFQVNNEGYLVAVGEGNGWNDGLREGLWGTMVDVDGDGKGDYEWGMPIKLQTETATNRVKIGSSTPDFHVGFNTNLRWKGVRAFMLWDAQIGGQVYNRAKQRAYAGVARAHGDLDQAGKPDELKKPYRYYQTFFNTSSTSSYFIEDATFLKLRELSLSYRIGRDGLRSLLGSRAADLFQAAELGITGRNLFTLTGYTGYDPEVGVGDATLLRYDNFDYPIYRTVTARVVLEF